MYSLNAGIETHRLSPWHQPQSSSPQLFLFVIVAGHQPTGTLDHKRWSYFPNAVRSVILSTPRLHDLLGTPSAQGSTTYALPLWNYGVRMHRFRGRVSSSERYDLFSPQIENKNTMISDLVRCSCSCVRVTFSAGS